jgi:hypothetical protein
MSSVPGVAMKATQPGFIIGRAFDSYNTPDKTTVGKIMAFVSLTWADPSVQLTSDGNLNIADVLPSDIASSSGSLSFPVMTALTENMNGGAPLSATSSATVDLGSLSSSVTQLQTQYASLSAQLGKIDDLSKQLTDLEKTINPTQGLQGTGSPSAVLGASTPSEDTAIGGRFNVLGRTVLSDLGVTGTINTGLLTIDGMDANASGSATINTLSGPLKLQPLGLGGLDILNGKVTLDTMGNLVVNGDITAKTIHADKFEANDAGSSTSLRCEMVPVKPCESKQRV